MKQAEKGIKMGKGKTKEELIEELNSLKEKKALLKNIEALKKKEELINKLEKKKRKNRKIKALRLALIVTAMFLVITYFLLKIIYETGAFTISLDPQLEKNSGIVMYERADEKEHTKRILKAKRLEFMDNISISWLPNNLNDEADGSHNGENYIAYTFYLENKGVDTINYWYKIVIDDVIKNVDNAVRVMVYRNDEKHIYAKNNLSTGGPEKGTEIFHSTEVVMLEQRKDFKADEVDKFTIVIFLEGDDPECIDNIIGGEMKMHMEITEEHIDQNGNPVATDLENYENV